MPRHVTSPAEVEAVLADPTLNVRPPAEPVPTSLVGTQLGSVMSQLPRFTDGEAHTRYRAVTERLIAGIDSGLLAGYTRRAAAAIGQPATAHDWMVAICPTALAAALGFGSVALVPEVSEVARALAPGATQAGMTQGIEFADRLWRRLTTAFPGEVERAAAIGLMLQGFDSVAALIGNGLIAHARSAADVRRLIVTRPPIRNTRRYDAAGKVTIVDLESATTQTGGMPSYAFGFGPHRCPGQVIAFTIATAALELAPRLAVVPDPVAYLPYPNANVPDLRRVGLDWSSL